MTLNTTRLLTGFGSAILLGTSALHLFGLSIVRPALETVEPAFNQGTLTASWIVPSLHWLFIACLAFGLSVYKSKIAAAMLMAFGLLLLSDAVLLFTHVGTFIGVGLLGLSGLSYLIGGFLLRREMYRLL